MLYSKVAIRHHPSYTVKVVFCLDLVLYLQEPFHAPVDTLFHTHFGNITQSALGFIDAEGPVQTSGNRIESYDCSSSQLCIMNILLMHRIRSFAERGWWLP